MLATVLSVKASAEQMKNSTWDRDPILAEQFFTVNGDNREWENAQNYCEDMPLTG